MAPKPAPKESVVKPFTRRGLWIAALIAVVGAGSAGGYYALRGNGAQASIPAAPPPTPVSVASVEQRDIALWDEFSGRLEAVERVEVRSRVAGAVDAVHFREGALVRQGDLLITIDPAPYAAEVDRAKAQVQAAQARVLLTKSELDRGEQLSGSRIISLKDLAEKLTRLHRGGRYELVAFPAERKAIDIGDYYSDFSLIRRELGWSPKIGLDEGLVRTIEYVGSNRRHYWDGTPA